MAAVSSWADPGDGGEIVGLILRRLPCFYHRALFRAVCRNWLTEVQNHPGPQPHLPWLLLPSSAAAGQDPCFFCILCRTTHRATLPDDVRAARCIGSARGGMLILALQQTGDYAFYNIRNSSRRYYLPEVLRTPDPVNDHLMVIHAACFAGRDEGVDNVIYVAGIGAWSASSIAFWRITVPMQEIDSWGEMLPQGRSIVDALYYGGHALDGLHVLTDDEKVLVYIPGHTPDGTPTMHLVTYHFPGHEVTRHVISRYLVEYDGDLLMVARVATAEAFRFARLVPQPPPELNGQRWASWVKMPVLPPGIIFLGRSCSKSYPSYGIDFDGVYFLDDATSYHDEATRALEPAATRQYPCNDMGWGPLLEHANIQPIFPARHPSEYSRAVWLFP
ncbi:hypothetical protein PR202_ga07363 [Eleusine coracana subsp. coracana]|uniref:KIB1-4 beta-propeller domain-containing protein n=1 Tax=Eleusine coracana subsp. coracana TaxID=191504 RepID=A0AAV5BZS2_ELECO|nr:hypothetical protein QOZ80_2AG0111160 [Eleusine coracana subsp. coracana]GJM91028.1 hypothetical protein PR202_ga07363 [Eleusine coracana subsp. coracana]